MPNKATGDSLRFWFHFTALADGASKTGLAPAINVYRNTTTTPIATGTATELGTTGLYYFEVAGALTGTAGEYIAVASTTDATVTAKALAALYTVDARYGLLDNLDAAISSRPDLAAMQAGLPSIAGIQAIVPDPAAYTAGRAAQLDNLDAAISTRSTLDAADVTAAVPTAPQNADAVWDEAVADHTLTGSVGRALNAASSYNASNITVKSPVISNALARITRGDDYKKARNSALEWTLVNVADSLAGATVAINVQVGASMASYAAEVLVATAPQRISLELTHVQTEALLAGTYLYDLQITHSNGDVFTPVRGGQWIVEADVR